MKKVSMIFGLLVIVTMAAFAQAADSVAIDPVVVEEAGRTFMELLQGIVVPLVVLVLGYFKVIDWIKGGKGAQKTADVLNKVESGMDSIAIIAAGVGMERVSTFMKEGADVVDASGNVAQFIADNTADGDFTKDEALGALEKFQEVIVELKDFRIKVFPKKKD